MIWTTLIIGVVVIFATRAVIDVFAWARKRRALGKE